MDSYIRQIEGYLLATGLDDYTLTEDEKHALASVLDGGAALPSLNSDDSSQVWVKESREFRIGDLFDTSIWTYGKNKQYKSRLHEPTDNSLCVVSGVTTNNGINYYTEDAVDESEIFNDCLTISTRGEYSGTVFYQTQPFVLANNILTMQMPDLTKRQKLYIASCINKLPFGGYNRYPRKDTLAESLITLPITPSGSPDFDFMETYIRAIEKLVIADVVEFKNKRLELTKTII